MGSIEEVERERSDGSGRGKSEAVTNVGLVPGLPPTHPNQVPKSKNVLVSYTKWYTVGPSLGRWRNSVYVESQLYCEARQLATYAAAPQLSAYFPSNLWSSFHPDFRRCHVQT